MKQIVQDVQSGETTVADVPAPAVGEAEVLVAVAVSALSPGTERYVVELSRKSLLQKAKDRPDHVRRVLQKVRHEGLRSTIRQVREKLAEPMPLGYSAAGVVLECGNRVRGIKPGDRVAVAAPHADIVSAGQNLCARVPDGVSFEQAAYAGIGAVAMHGVRLAKVSLGEDVLVIGLGLIGLITVALLKAQGCRVFGVDVDDARFGVAMEFGADEVRLGNPLGIVSQFTRRRGVDAVIITTSTSSNAPIEFAAEACRQKGRIVLVGVAGLNVPRPPFFKKELEFTVSSSMGPGRGDSIYEEKGIDYPIGYARWTLQRNLEAILDQMASGRLPVERLTSHQFSIDDGAKAYELLVKKHEPYLGIILKYADRPERTTRRVNLHSAAVGRDRLRLSVIGAGNYGRLMALPLLAKFSDVELQGLCSAKGLSALYGGAKHQFKFATSAAEEIIADPDTDAVLILTRHDLHADLVTAALKAGKHVFVEKPLCITLAELAQLAALVEGRLSAGPLLMVGFNRRFAPALRRVRAHFEDLAPLSVTYRFSVPDLPPESWPQDVDVGGGRLVGEACHGIDACITVTNSPVVRVFAESVMPSGEAQTPDDRVFISMRHADGSISCVSYQSGGDPAGPKERLEAFGGGRTAVIDNFDHVELWDKNRQQRIRGGRDKGHHAALRAFVDACRSGGAWPIPWQHLYSSAWAPLAAMHSLRTGQPAELESAST